MITLSLDLQSLHVSELFFPIKFVDWRLLAIYQPQNYISFFLLKITINCIVSNKKRLLKLQFRGGGGGGRNETSMKHRLHLQIPVGITLLCSAKKN